ncbi:hypothetical protein PSA01_65050 [Pseudonocardia saturnea]|uniref:Uncharacterized protein n=2 Tax=Pseudonocardia TaxID=1847 RepID=A0A1Y2MGY4_PSEAH|nr:hypothetical protein BG845_06743 [Pseudonocardia autotrophica]BBG05699.1 hypothetical protein Pdca_69080 [Pseudonocardia autotrophica]GEC29476.1 hypothetical protein PSA01_65050 [Pseudonocardia saturnea]
MTPTPIPPKGILVEWGSSHRAGRGRYGHVRQPDAVAARLLARVVTATPTLDRAGQLAFGDLDGTVGQTFGGAEQGAGRDYSDVKGLNALIATRVRVGVSSVIAAIGLRQLLADALATAHHLR